jgi:hypothetical protein
MKRAAIRLSDRDIIRRGTLKAGSGASVPVPRSPHGVNRGILALPKVPLTNAPFGGPHLDDAGHMQKLTPWRAG